MLQGRLLPPLASLLEQELLARFSVAWTFGWPLPTLSLLALLVEAWCLVVIS